MPLLRPALLSLCALALLPLSLPAVAKSHDESAKEQDAEPGFNTKTFAGLKLRAIGPALMSGRIADIKIHPEDRATWYVAAGSGGVWKTDNAGTTWTPLFDGQASYSIGALAIDPSNPNVIYAGTGENVGGRHVGYGDGLYRSRDGGKSWENIGLEKSEHIGSIVIHPDDPDTLLIAAQGPLWSGGGERGVFRTTDGGETWTNVLSGGQYTGANEVVMDPRNPDVLYASTHQRLRSVAALVNGGPESGIHKSTDGGKTWRALSTGLPEEDMGKIGLAVSPQDSSIVYATIELARRKGGFYRSTDGGETWEKRSDYVSGGTGPHYYQEIFASPHFEDRVYQMDVRMHWSTDGGKTMTAINEAHKHSDNHALAFNDDPDYMLIGTDGGLYETWDHGAHWKYINNLPLTQFYKVAVDTAEPFYNVYGGTQDNNSQGGPSRTDNVHGITNSDWFVTLFGDGHQSATDPSNPNIVYAEWQQGNLVRHDRKTGEIVYIQPQPGAGEPPERWNWDAPILVSPHDPKTLYFASQRVWKSDNRGDAWLPISKDLTGGGNRMDRPIMGRTWSPDAVWDLLAMSKFGTITSLSESPVKQGLLYAGTDDGRIHVSGNDGKSWSNVSKGLPGLPDGSFVNDVKADRFDANTVYAAFDNHKQGDFAPYLFKSTNRGKSWTSIAGNLPERHLVWRIVQDHEQPELLFAGTEFGLFFSPNAGGTWVELSGGVPTIAFRDVAIQERENDLVGATFGRGFYVLDDYSALRELDEKTLKQEATLFGVRDAWWYVPRRRLGVHEKASQGASFYTAPNPDFGATFTYYLAEDYQTAKQQRREVEKEQAEAGTDVPFPGWEAVAVQDEEDEPEMILTVRDADKQIIRRVTGPAKAGFHRVSWDLRHPPTEAITTPQPSDEFRYVPAYQALAAPGQYTVELGKRVNGVYTQLGKPQGFQVKPMTTGTLKPAADHKAAEAFMLEVAELERRHAGVTQILTHTAERIDILKRAIDTSRAQPELAKQLRAIERQLQALTRTVNGNPAEAQQRDQEPHTIGRRLFTAQIGVMFSTYGPTTTHRQSLALGQAALSQASDRLRTLVEEDLSKLEKELDDAGVPWTPGRAVPMGR